MIPFEECKVGKKCIFRNPNRPRIAQKCTIVYRGDIGDAVVIACPSSYTRWVNIKYLYEPEENKNET